MTHNIKQNIKEELNKGVDIRFHQLEELRLRIIDGEKSMIGVVNPLNHDDRIGIFIESKELSKALEYYFDTIWKKSKKLLK